MPLTSLDHVNIRTPQPARSLAFYRDVLGLVLSATPGRPDLEKGGWAMLGDRAVIHIGAVDAAYPSDPHAPFASAPGGGSVHHVAFRCQDHAAMKARLDERNIAYDENAVVSIGLRQIFLHDPDGVMIELNFPGD